jgi:peptidoglycan hydrolase-like protein with peptidoglycan-binding domain
MTSRHSLRRTCALVVTAAAVLLLGTTSSAFGQVAGQTGRDAPRLLTAPSPEAGWHGKPIRRPLPRRSVARAATTAAGARLALGDGYGSPRGSQAVRALQRVLLGLGYTSGRADGMFGPRTQASLAWFQIKHGLTPTGVADATTLQVVRRRDGARTGRPIADPGRRTPAQAQRSATTTAAAQHPATTTGAPARPGSGGLGLLPLVLLLATGAALLSLLTTLAWRRTRRGDLAPRTRARVSAGVRSLWAAARSRRRHAAPAPDAAGATGHPAGRDAPELHPDAAVAANGHAPVPSVALDRLGTHEPPRVANGRLDHMARSLAGAGPIASARRRFLR